MTDALFDLIRVMMMSALQTLRPRARVGVAAVELVPALDASGRVQPARIRPAGLRVGVQSGYAQRAAHDTALHRARGRGRRRLRVDEAGQHDTGP